MTRSVARDVLKVLARRPHERSWEELRKGQGCGFVVDLGIGGPSLRFETERRMSLSSPFGSELLTLMDGYYSEHPSWDEESSQDPPFVLRRTKGRPVGEDPFPVEVPCLRAEAVWNASSAAVRVRQVYLVIWHLRRNHLALEIPEGGAEQAARDKFVDFADLGIRLEMDQETGPVTGPFFEWLINELA